MRCALCKRSFMVRSTDHDTARRRAGQGLECTLYYLSGHASIIPLPLYLFHYTESPAYIYLNIAQSSQDGFAYLVYIIRRVITGQDHSGSRYRTTLVPTSDRRRGRKRWAPSLRIGKSRIKTSVNLATRLLASLSHLKTSASKLFRYADQLLLC